MLQGKRCKVGTGLDKNKEGFKFYEGIIESEAEMERETGDFWVIVLFEGRLIRTDTYYIYDVEI